MLSSSDNTKIRSILDDLLLERVDSIGNHADTEDLLQDATSKWNQTYWRETEPLILEKQIKRFVRNNVINLRKRECKRKQIVKDLILLTPKFLIPDSDLEREELGQSLHGSLAGLSAEDRDLVDRLYWQNQTRDRIAKELGVSPKTIQRRLHDLMNRLKQFLSDDGFD